MAARQQRQNADLAAHPPRRRNGPLYSRAMPPEATGGGGTGRPYGGRSPDERRAERRRRLIDAALELYGTQGYRATSVAQICRTARVAPAKFYEQFTSSEQLLIALCAEIWEPIRSHVLEAMAAAAPAVGKMTKAGVDAYCHDLLDDPRRARVLCIELRGVSRAAETARREQIVQFATLSQVGFQAITGGATATATSSGGDGDSRPARRLDDRQLAALATALVGAIDEAMRHWLYEPEPRPPIDDLVDMLMTVYVAVGSYLAAGRGP